MLNTSGSNSNIPSRDIALSINPPPGQERRRGQAAGGLLGMKAKQLDVGQPRFLILPLPLICPCVSLEGCRYTSCVVFCVLCFCFLLSAFWLVMMQQWKQG